jgi:hypothetical protein
MPQLPNLGHKDFLVLGLSTSENLREVLPENIKRF